jgi:thioredoxin-like negative regulator of GroEL
MSALHHRLDRDSAPAPPTGGTQRDAARPRALLVFFYSPRSGPSRRMDGLVSWLFVRERKRLRVRMVNVDVCVRTAERYGITQVPTLVLIKGREIVARLEGRVTGQQLDDAVLPHLGR